MFCNNCNLNHTAQEQVSPKVKDDLTRSVYVSFAKVFFSSKVTKKTFNRIQNLTVSSTLHFIKWTLLSLISYLWSWATVHDQNRFAVQGNFHIFTDFGLIKRKHCFLTWWIVFLTQQTGLPLPSKLNLYFMVILIKSVLVVIHQLLKISTKLSLQRCSAFCRFFSSWFILHVAQSQHPSVRFCQLSPAVPSKAQPPWQLRD